MSATITYEQNVDVGIVGSSFIGSEEATLLASAIAGDSAAFESLVMPHWGGLLCVTERILCNREDAEDAVQNTARCFSQSEPFPRSLTILLHGSLVSL